jgi:hypothetical protein
MDAIILPDSNQLYVVLGGRTAAGRLLELAARLALRGPLLVLDCGNRANPLPLVRELRRLTLDPVRVLQNIQSARAFTCYQALALMEQAASRTARQPVLIFDLLATFYDESVSYREGQQLLEQSLDCIMRMCQSAPVVVSLRPPLADFPERRAFVEMVCSRSGQFGAEEPPHTEASSQLSLFS